MKPESRNIEETLLDWHLGLLDDEERTWIEQELDRDASLQRKSDRLGQRLQPLDLWRVPSANPRLIETVLSRIAEEGVAPTQQAPLTEDADRIFVFPRVPIREWVVVAACILLLVGITVPGVSELRHRSRRSLCSNNLSGLFRGTSTYQQAYAGMLPFAGNVPGSSWLPSGAIDRPYASNSRHAFLLVKHGHVSNTQMFLCPSDESGKMMDSHLADQQDDFNRADNISYATLNQSGMRPQIAPTIPLAYMSDPNPLFANACFNPNIDPERTNSSAHRGRGQMVLTLDGRVRWMTRPVYGQQKDNLWVIQGYDRYIGIESLSSQNDVQLVPGYPATDPMFTSRQPR